MYMSRKNQSTQILAEIDAKNHRWHIQTKSGGADWVQEADFWLMGTITFYEQRKGAVFEDERQKLMRLLFNATDRNLLPRKFTHTDLKKEKTLKERYNKRQVRQRHTSTRRLERVVYDELGRLRDFSHTHFFIKGTTDNYRLRLIQEQLIVDTMTEAWERFGTIDFKANSNSLYQTGYGYKEKNTQANTGTFNNTCSFLLN